MEDELRDDHLGGEVGLLGGGGKGEPHDEEGKEERVGRNVRKVGVAARRVPRGAVDVARKVRDQERVHVDLDVGRRPEERTGSGQGRDRGERYKQNTRKSQEKDKKNTQKHV